MDILREIRQNYQFFTQTQKRIADYILANPELACFESLKELSEKARVTEVTISNFAKKLGLDSFLALKKQIQYFIQAEASPNTRIGVALTNMKEIDAELGGFIDSSLVNIDNSIGKLDIKDVKKAAHLINKADKVYLLGVGVSEVICTFFRLRLKLLGLEVEYFEISSYNILSLKTLRLKKEDLFIIVSFPQYSRMASLFVKYLDSKKIPMICIADSTTSPLAKYSSVIFECGNASKILYNSMIAPTLIAEILVFTLFKEREKQILPLMNDIRELEDIYKNENLYEP